ncbi:hypothetical protein Asp14428_42420 [Actinoplanes sp. NBRC 14428]|nr:hypothetical protein Asp14428_42420 [Actinoplanes sp. NBRC 14428]
MTESRFAEVLTIIADDARPARLAPDTWRRGVRRRRTRMAAGVLAAVAVVAAVPLVLGGHGGQSPTPADSPRPVVPSTVYPPVTGEDTVLESPPGPAAILVAGDRELRGSDIWGFEGRSLLVGRSGGYRLARSVGEMSAGTADGLLLSPDGRYLAGGLSMEGVDYPPEGDPQTGVLDLTTGTVRQYGGGDPMAWSPDGRFILVRGSSGNTDHSLYSMHLLEVATGRKQPLPRAEGEFLPGNVAAFSPDGKRLAVATTTSLQVFDLAGNTRTEITGLTDRDRLAGPGAWLPDGRRIAMYSITGCVDGTVCDEAALRQREFRVRYLDAGTGQPADGPRLDPARGLAVRMLGWQREGSAVVAVHSPERGARLDPDDAPWLETDYWTVGGVELSAFGPDGGRRRLVDLPGGAGFVDVPTGLLDQFGGPAPNRVEGAARRALAWLWPVGQVLELLAVLAVAALVLRIRHVRRRARRRAGSTAPLR